MASWICLPVSASKLEARTYPMPGFSRNARSTLGRFQFLGCHRELKESRVAGAAYIEPRLVLARLRQQLHNLLELETSDRDSVHREDLIARAEAGLGSRRSGQNLQHDHPAGQYRDDRPESFPRGIFELLELLELAGIEEDTVRVEPLEHARDGSLVERFVRSDRVGRLALHHRIHIHEPLKVLGYVFGHSRGRQQK